MDHLAPDYEWWDDTIANAKEYGESKGFDIRDIHFTGFYSQGDGACWVGRVDIVEWLEINKPEDPRAHILSALIENDWIDRYLVIEQNPSRYSHSNTMQRSDASINCEDEDDFISKADMFQGASVRNLMQSLPDTYLNDISDEILADARCYANDIYNQLRDEYEHLCSEEVVAEMCDANDYLFDEHGDLI